MPNRTRRLLSRTALPLLAAALAVGAVSSAPAAALNGSENAGTRIHTISRRSSNASFPATGGTGTFRGIQSPEFRPEPEGEEAERVADRSLSRRPSPGEVFERAAVAPVPRVQPTAVGGAPGLGSSFTGLTAFDQRFANGGNQFSVEPPDQALCVGNGQVLEATNDVLRVYGPGGGAKSAVTDLNTFYGYPAQIDRATGRRGPFVTDPICHFDDETQRFFVVVLTIDTRPRTGAFTGTNHLDIAVSRTDSALGGWRFYSIPVTNNGTSDTPTHNGCPCIGDYPHLGVDAHGFYISTNEYPFDTSPGVFGNNFNGAQVYAMSKRDLARGVATLKAVQFENLHIGAVPGFTVWPSSSIAGQHATENNGTEYFLGSIAGAESLSETGREDRIGVWSLTNTASLDSANPNVRLAGSLRPSQPYGVPPLSEQKFGPTPLRDCLVIECLEGIGLSTAEVEGPLDSSDSRMQQVWLSNGRLFGALDSVMDVAGEIKAGIAWFVVDPGGSPSTSRIVNQGYLGVAGNNVSYPAIAVLPNGKGVMSMTLVGTDYFPTAAYTTITAGGGTDGVHIAGLGQGPQDGFSEYKFFGNPPRPRWGDYGAAAIADGSVWIASEYIADRCTLKEFNRDPTCGNERGALVNWATRVSNVRP